MLRRSNPDGCGGWAIAAHGAMAAGMVEPLTFYPARSVVLTQYWIAAGAAGIGLLLCGSLLGTPPAVGGWSWALDAAKVAGTLLCGVGAGLAWRRAGRIAAARGNAEPQLVVDPFGVLIRDDFLWRAHRFPWSRITSIDAIPDSKGLSIVVRGRLGALGRLVDVTTDSDEPAEAVALRLERIARRPTLH